MQSKTFRKECEYEKYRRLYVLWKAKIIRCSEMKQTDYQKMLNRFKKYKFSDSSPKPLTKTLEKYIVKH